MTLTGKSIKRATDLDTHVGRQLRAMREASGLTQEAMGQRVDLSFQQIQKYENGVNRISASRLYEFSRVLEVPVSAFFKGLPMPTVGDDSSSQLQEKLVAFVNTAEGTELLEAFRQISSAKIRRETIRMVQLLAGDIIASVPE